MNASDELQPLLGALGELQASRRQAALITLTHTRGATFRDVGTRMLVYADGSSVCELSGGCPQHDIINHARATIDAGEPRLVRYNAEYGLDVLMEMGCGGDLDVLIEPLGPGSDLAYVQALQACIGQRREGVLATVFARDGEIMPTRHALWCGGEPMYEDLADDALRKALQDSLRNPPARPASAIVESADGRFDVLIEPVVPAHALVVIGSSTAAQALLPLAGHLGWPATLVDFDAERIRDIALPDGAQGVHAPPSSLLDNVVLDAATSVVVMTHNLQQDADYLAVLHGSPVAYVGLLGARGRVKRVLERAGLATDGGIHGPVGLDIGAESPAEIALAIVAEIMAATRGHAGGPLRGPAGTAP